MSSVTRASLLRGLALCAGLFALVSGDGARAQTVTRAPAWCAAAPALTPGVTVHGTTVGAGDHSRASCARGALSGERAYVLQLTEDARVSLRVRADYDAALYVRSSCDDEVSELACNDDAEGSPQRSSLDIDLRAGTYWVFVDGYDTDNEGRFELSVTLRPSGLASTRRGGNGRATRTSAPPRS